MKPISIIYLICLFHGLLFGTSKLCPNSNCTIYSLFDPAFNESGTYYLESTKIKNPIFCDHLGQDICCDSDRLSRMKDVFDSLIGKRMEKCKANFDYSIGNILNTIASMKLQYISFEKEKPNLQEGVNQLFGVKKLFIQTALDSFLRIPSKMNGFKQLITKLMDANVKLSQHYIKSQAAIICGYCDPNCMNNPFILNSTDIELHISNEYKDKSYDVYKQFNEAFINVLVLFKDLYKDFIRVSYSIPSNAIDNLKFCVPLCNPNNQTECEMQLKFNVMDQLNPKEYDATFCEIFVTNQTCPTTHQLLFNKTHLQIETPIEDPSNNSSNPTISNTTENNTDSNNTSNITQNNTNSTNNTDNTTSPNTTSINQTLNGNLVFPKGSSRILQSLINDSNSMNLSNELNVTLIISSDGVKLESIGINAGADIDIASTINLDVNQTLIAELNFGYQSGSSTSILEFFQFKIVLLLLLIYI